MDRIEDREAVIGDVFVDRYGDVIEVTADGEYFVRWVPQDRAQLAEVHQLIGRDLLGRGTLRDFRPHYGGVIDPPITYIGKRENVEVCNG